MILMAHRHGLRVSELVGLRWDMLDLNQGLLQVRRLKQGRPSTQVLFLEDGRIELDTNVIERAIRPIALGRKNALFAGSDGGARHWAIVASLVATAKLNGVEPLAWLTDVLERMVSGRTKAHELARLLPWAWKAERLGAALDA